MSHTVRHGEHYWSLVSPHWLALNESWSHGASYFLSCLHRVPLKVQHLYSAYWCQSDVCNGGFHQFFYNTTGILAPEAVAGFEAVGAGQLASLVGTAISRVGAPYPRDRSARLSVLPQADGRPREEWDPFTDLDNRFYEWLDSESSRWDILADNYASDA